MRIRMSTATRVFGLATILTCTSLNLKADTLPPTVPVLLSATAATCGQVNLSWTSSTDEVGGSGMMGYTINRYDSAGLNTPMSIGAVRTTYSDTNWVKSSSTFTYSVEAFDNARNWSAPSNSVTVTTPTCPK